MGRLFWTGLAFLLMGNFLGHVPMPTFMSELATAACLGMGALCVLADRLFKRD